MQLQKRFSQLINFSLETKIENLSKRVAVLSKSRGGVRESQTSNKQYKSVKFDI